MDGVRFVEMLTQITKLRPSFDPKKNEFELFYANCYSYLVKRRMLLVTQLFHITRRFKITKKRQILTLVFWFFFFSDFGLFILKGLSSPDSDLYSFVLARNKAF